MRYLITIFFALFINDANAKISFRFKEAVQLVVPVTERLTYCLYNEHFYYCKLQFNIKNDNISLVIYDYHQRRTDSLILVFPFSKSLEEWGISSIRFSDSNIAVMADSVYVFDNKKTLIRRLNSYHVDDMFFVNDSCLLLYQNYNIHPLTDTQKTKLILYNFHSGKIVQKLAPPFRYILYTHFVGNYLSVSDNEIAFSQAVPYKINFFEKRSLLPLDSISNIMYNNAGVINYLDSLHRNAKKNHIAKKNYYEVKVIDSAVTRIEKVLFLSDDQLLVSKKLPNSGFMFRGLDVWEKKNNIWKLVINDQIYKTEIEEDYKITPETIPLNFTYSDKLISSNNLIYVLNDMAPPKLGINNRELKGYYNDFYSKNELNYYIWIYDWQID